MSAYVKSTVGGSRLPLGRVIRDALVERIVTGELAAGERLVETRLAADFGTSQTPVREALRELEGIGLVEVVPRRGTFVLPFVEQTLKESYVVRASLEETATRLAILNGTLPVTALRTDVANMTTAAVDADSDALGRASVSFHRHVMEASGNGLLLHAWEALQIEARTAATLLATELDLVAVAEDHAHLLASLESGDLNHACLAARDHQWAYADLPHDAHGRHR
ncbi:GntR family transcriptional regulator [Spiractinospora alimapuensis]|uniref:GntR family transcriptional regulator n=1 Tax=Spiractinospora alimapuensis TaxID=2820884 RepID=UPI001F22FE78|nr:GntR family transcriptional regulator [Spiractinospora alimapuensis]QVQ53332.1 GntR family transcriptional regulator [Spiractinospora alimapuensis]